MTTKPEMTLENVCFRYDGSDEAKECFRAFREKTKCLWSPQEGMIYGIVDNKPKIDFAPVIGFIEISPSDYLLLLSAPESQAHLLTEKDLIVGYECIEDMKSPMGKLLFKKGKTYFKDKRGMLESKKGFGYPFDDKFLNRHFKLASQPPVMEGIEKSPYKKFRTILARHQNMTMLSPMQINNFCRAMNDLNIEKQSTISSLQSEVEQLKGLLKEAQPFCGTMLRGKIEHYTSK